MTESFRHDPDDELAIQPDEPPRAIPAALRAIDPLLNPMAEEEPAAPAAPTTGATPLEAPERPGEPPRWWAWLAGLTVLSTAFADVGALVPGLVGKKALTLTPFDALVWAAAVAWGVYAWRAGRLREELAAWARCVWPGMALVAAGLLSCRTPLAERMATDAWLGAGKILFQWTEYLLVAPFAFLPLVRTVRGRRRMAWALILAMFAAFLSLCWRTPPQDVLAGDVHPYFAGGLLGNRHTYALYMGLALCLVAGWQGDRFRPYRFRTPMALALLVLPAAALWPAFSGGVLAAALAGLAVAWGAARRGATLLVVPLGMWLFLAGPGVWPGTDWTEARLEYPRLLVRSAQAYRPDADGQTVATMRFRRWAAELNVFLQHPETGVGVGQYQRRLDDGFGGDIPKARARTDDVAQFDLAVSEDMTFSWFGQIACQTGLAGLAALLVLLGEIAGRATGRGGWPSVASGGLLGAVVVLGLAAFWTQPLARGTGPLLGLMLALSAVPAAGREK